MVAFGVFPGASKHNPTAGNLLFVCWCFCGGHRVGIYSLANSSNGIIVSHIKAKSYI
jgi:hypothetical protein